jgi:hypothetical protein
MTRNRLLAIALLVAMALVATGSGALTSVDAGREMSVSVVSDQRALLEIETAGDLSDRTGVVDGSPFTLLEVRDRFPTEVHVTDGRLTQDDDPPIEIVSAEFGSGVRVECVEATDADGESVTVQLTVASESGDVQVTKHSRDVRVVCEASESSPVPTTTATTTTPGESPELVVGVGNHENEAMTYTVVVELQRVRVQGESISVVEARELERYGVSLDDNETVQRKPQIRPSMTGDRLRLTYLLYRGDPPADPAIANAYRSVYRWVNVTDA